MSAPIIPLNETPCIVVYDEECFFCSHYIQFMNLKASMGNVTLINARDKEKVEALQLRPADLNEGMAFIVGKQYYSGADAIYHMALLSTNNTLFNKLNRFIFKHHWLAILLYPALKLGRRAYLLLAGKDIIR